MLSEAHRLLEYLPPHLPANFCKHQAGELVAVAYPQPKAGYKNPMAYGAKPKLSTEV
jgi:hypothetical protein